MFPSELLRSSRWVLKVSVSVFCFALLSGNLCADLVFHVGAGALQPDENLLFNDPALISTGIMIEGITNNSGSIFEVSSNDAPQEELTAPSGGQARIEAVDGAYTSIFIEAQDNFFFSELEFNVNTLHRTFGTFELSIVDQNGNIFLDDFSSDTLGPGANFFSVEATNGMLMRSATLTASSEIIQDVRQIRVGTAVPEPTAAVLLAVVSMLGITVRRRRI